MDASICETPLEIEVADFGPTPDIPGQDHLLEHALDVARAACRQGQRPFRPWIAAWVKRARSLAEISDSQKRELAAEALGMELYEFADSHAVAYPVLIALDKPRRAANAELESCLTSEDAIPNALRTLNEDEFFRWGWKILKLRRRHEATCPIKGKPGRRGDVCSCPYWFPSEPDRPRFRRTIEQIVAEETERVRCHQNPLHAEADQAALNQRVLLAYAQEIVAIGSELDLLEAESGTGSVSEGGTRFPKAFELEALRTKLQGEMICVCAGRIPAEDVLGEALSRKRLEALGDLWLALYSDSFQPFPPPNGAFRALLNRMRREGDQRAFTGTGEFIPTERFADRHVVMDSGGEVGHENAKRDFEEIECRLTLDRILGRVTPTAGAFIKYFFENPEGQLRDWKEASCSLGLKEAVGEAVRKRLGRDREQLRSACPQRGTATDELGVLMEEVQRDLPRIRKSLNSQGLTRLGPHCAVCKHWAFACASCSPSFPRKNIS